MWGIMAYPFPNVNSAAVEVWELMINFIPKFTVITHPSWDQSSTKLVKGAPERGSGCSSPNMQVTFSYVNTSRPTQNGRHFPDDNFKWIFVNGKAYIPNEI